MKSIMLERDGDAPLVFEGELLAEARGGDPDRSRWHELALYRSRAGNYVLEARYESRWQGESGAREALVLDGPASLRTSLRAYDPLKNVVATRPARRTRGSRPVLKRACAGTTSRWCASCIGCSPNRRFSRRWSSDARAH